VAKAASASGLVAAIDLCGPEAGNPPHRFKEAFEVASAAGLKVTVHAGEGAESLDQNLKNIEEAILLLGASRLGHAVPLVKSRKLLDLVIERSIAVEMNPVSNLVLRNIGDLRDLGIDRLLARGVNVSVNSDDPGVWPNGKLSDVYSRACGAYGFGFVELDKLVGNSFEGSFATRGEKAHLEEKYREARRKVNS
jgi:adenosine deaminase